MRRSLAIVDNPESGHGRAMRECGRLGRHHPAIHWVQPSWDLPARIDRVQAAGVAALAVPVFVVDGNPDDLFTCAVVDALLSCPPKCKTFDAAGIGRPHVERLMPDPAARSERLVLAGLRPSVTAWLYRRALLRPRRGPRHPRRARAPTCGRYPARVSGWLRPLGGLRLALAVEAARG